MSVRKLFIWGAVALLLTATIGWSAPIKTDFVFMIDGSASMANDIAAVKAGLSAFVDGLSAATVDARFAIVLFGGPPELVLDFTSSGADTETAFGKIGIGAVAGFQQTHNLNPEAGLEAIRIVLGMAADNTLIRTFVGGAGSLAFRPDARKNLILVTDEDSDHGFYAGNRRAGQGSNEPPAAIAGTDWQKEVDDTAAAVIQKSAFINMLVNVGDVPVASQYGNPGSSVQDANFLNFDPDATYAKLVADGFGNSLEAQVLKAGLIGRAFNITQIDTANFVDNFFAAKIKETIDNPLPLVPEPSSYLLMAGGLGSLVFLARRRSFRNR